MEEDDDDDDDDDGGGGGDYKMLLLNFEAIETTIRPQTSLYFNDFFQSTTKPSVIIFIPLCKSPFSYVRKLF
jgi:hypothetical protein